MARQSGPANSQVAALCEAFPSLSLAAITDCLERYGDVEAAAAALLQEPPQPPKPRGSLRHSQAHSASWGMLADAGQRQPQPPVKVRFKPARRSPADLPAGQGAGAQPPAGVPQQTAASAAHARRSPAQQPAQQQGSAAAPGAAVQQLLEVHGWAGRELAEAVLEAVGQDVELAASVLADMLEPAAAAAADGRSSPQPAPAAGPAGAAPAAAAAAAAAERQGGASGSPGDASEDEAEAEQADPYYRYRRTALQLTRRWQSAARGAAAAYAGGCHGEARQLAARAQRLRREALAAHAAAAERIEAENNAHNGLLELDLHGLHAQEATAAVDRRLELLRGLLAEPGTAAALAASQGGTPGAAVGPRGPCGLRLRVVVGRGLHSSGGEASIPRVVAAHLEAGGHRFEHRQPGALDVRLRAPSGA